MPSVLNKSLLKGTPTCRSGQSSYRRLAGRSKDLPGCAAHRDDLACPLASLGSLVVGWNRRMAPERRLLWPHYTFGGQERPGHATAERKPNPTASRREGW